MAPPEANIIMVLFPKTLQKIDDNRFKVIGILAALIFIFDQLTKAVILHTIPLYRSVEVIPNFFNIVHVQNRGAAFGFLNNPDSSWQFWLFAVATVVALGMVYSIARTTPYSKFQNYCFGLIVGGALGNFLDRVRFQAVTDFLDFYVGAWHWPAFNVADIAITLGAIGAAWYIFKTDISATSKNVNS